MAERKLTAILLTLCILFGLVPMGIPAVAAEAEDTATTEFAGENPEEAVLTADTPAQPTPEEAVPETDLLPEKTNPTPDDPDATSYPLWVGGVRVTSSNCGDILGDGGSIVYTPASHTLAVNGFVTVTAPGGDTAESNVPIYATADLTITGSGRIDFGGARNAVQVFGGNLTVENGAFVFENAAHMLFSNGIVSVLNSAISIYAAGTDTAGIQAWTSVQANHSAIEVQSSQNGPDTAFFMRGILASVIHFEECDVQIGVTTSGYCTRATCISATDSLTFRDSKAEIGLNSAVYYLDGETYAVNSPSVTLDSSEVAITSTHPCVKSGDSSTPGNLVIGDSFLTAFSSHQEGGVPAIRFPGGGTIHVSGNQVSFDAEGTGGAIEGGTVDLGSNVNVLCPESFIIDNGEVLNPDYTVPTKVTLADDVYFPIWIGSVRVSAGNRSSIPGAIDGYASYDPNTRVLTLHGFRGVNGSCPVNYYNNASALICAKDQDLRVHSVGWSVLQSDTASDGILLTGSIPHTLTLEGNGLNIRAGTYAASSVGDLILNCDDVTADGGFNTLRTDGGDIRILRGNVTVTGRSGGIHAENGSVYIEGGNVDVTVDSTYPYTDAVTAWEGSVTVTGGTVRAQGGSCGIRADGSGAGIVIENADVSAHGLDFGIYSGGALSVSGDWISVAATSPGTAVHAEGGISLGTGLSVAQPEGGYPGAKDICMPGGAPATEVMILSDTFPVWVGPAQVTAQNLGDVLGDGKVSYDPSTHTLTLDHVSLTEANPETYAFIHADNDLTVTGSASLNSASVGYGITCGNNLTIKNAELDIDVIREGIGSSGTLDVVYSTVSVSAEIDNSYGLFSVGDMLLESSTITAHVKDGPNALGEVRSCCGIFSRSNLRIEGCVLDVTADGLAHSEGIASAEYIGMAASGTVKAYGSSAVGIRASDGMGFAPGCDLTVEGGLYGVDVTYQTNGFTVTNSKLRVSGGSEGFRLRDVPFTVNGELTLITAEGPNGAVVCDGVNIWAPLGVIEPEGGYYWDGAVVTPDGFRASYVVIANGYPPEITQHPTDQTVPVGDFAHFTVSAEGGTLPYTYQWRYRTSPSGGWRNVSSADGTHSNYPLKVQERHNGYQYQCVVMDAAGRQAVSDTATLTVTPAVVITLQPSDCTVAVGETASFTVAAEGGVAPLKYQWLYRTGPEDYWKTVASSSGKKATYTLTAQARHNGYQYQCVVEDQVGSFDRSTIATLTIGTPLTIDVQPADQTVSAGSTASFSVTASGGTEPYSFQWQYRKTVTGAWINISAASARTDTYTLTAEVRHNGYQYQCIVTDNAGASVTSRIAALTVGTPVVVSDEPADVTVTEGETAVFRVSVSGGTAPYQYQWQYLKPGASSWMNVSAAAGKTDEYSLKTELRHDGYQYRCVVTDSVGSMAMTKIVHLTVVHNVPLTVVSQPSAQNVPVGDTAVFSVTVEGGKAPYSYQWQYLKPGASAWADVAAASGKTDTYTMTAQARHDGYVYRCKITDNAGRSIFSECAALTVGSGPHKIADLVARIPDYGADFPVLDLTAEEEALWDLGELNEADLPVLPTESSFIGFAGAEETSGVFELTADFDDETAAFWGDLSVYDFDEAVDGYEAE